MKVQRIMSTVPTKLLLSSEVANKILRSMQEGLVVFDSEDRIQIMNDWALKIFGFSKNPDIIGKHVDTLFTTSEDAFNFLMHLEKEKQLTHFEGLFKKSTGEEITCSLSASIIRDSIEGDLIKVITLEDITERKNGERQLAEYSEKLEKNNQELDQFAYIVSHDLKAPLRAILNLSQWLYEDLETSLSDENRKNLELMRGRAFRMDSLISAILEYSKIGRTKIKSELIDVAALIAEIVDLLAPPNHIRIKISSEMPVLYAPKIMLLQVFSNLISNSIKYNDKAEGLVTVSFNNRKDSFEFVVEDNGPGIPKEYHDKVFAIFQTLQSRDKVESTGIGLTIVKRILEEQGGKVRIESEEGNGARFIFNWPKLQTPNTYEPSH